MTFNLIVHVYQIFRKINTCLVYRFIFSLSVPKISRNAIIDFLQELTSIWEQLGVALGVEQQVDIERTTSTTAQQKCMNVLRFWMSHTHASWPAFLDALTKLKKRQLAIQIEQHLLNENK